MLKIDITYIEEEAKYIMLNKISYIDEIILYALAFFETIIIIDNTNKLSDIFIKILYKLQPHIKCCIDFDFLKYVNNTNNNVTLLYNKLDSSNILYNSSNSNYSTVNMEDKINNMLMIDSNLITELLENNDMILRNDDYGEINNDVIDKAKELFNLIDINKDGYISAIDIIQVDKPHQLVFDSKIINILLLYGKIDFNQFFMFLI